MSILDLSEAPEDPLDRLIWLSGVERAVAHELEDERMRLTFEVRLQSRFEALIGLGLYSKNRLLAWCRAENNRRGRPVRWSDGLDRRSSSYSGGASQDPGGASQDS